MGCPKRCIEFHRDRKPLQMPIECRADHTPFELSLAASKRRDGERGNVPIFVMLFQILQPTNDVL
jgi:hypothetical protein